MRGNQPQEVQRDFETTPEVLPPIPEKARNGVPIGPRYRAAAELLETGRTVTEVAKALGVQRQTVSKVKNQIPKKYDLTSPSMVKLAGKAHNLILQAVVEPEKVKAPLPFSLKGSDVGAAIDRVYDRVQPTIRASEAPTTVSFVQVNIEQYNAPGGEKTGEVIDV